MNSLPLDREDVRHSDFAHDPQPVKGEDKAVEDPTSEEFRWKINICSDFNTEKIYSDSFNAGGYKWRIHALPHGKNADHLSMYLAVADSETLPDGWSIRANFSLSVIHPIYKERSIRRETEYLFNACENVWGFTSFMPFSKLLDPGRGYLKNGSVMVQASVAVIAHVGLLNQGTTCYLNSLLQALYHLPYFRKAVYQMPTTKNDVPSGSIPFALQNVFYNLQYSDTAVATKELTESFGWNTHDTSMQHDVQEFNRVLCEALDAKMKGTASEGTIQQLFEGHQVNSIECIDVEYNSTTEEPFYDLQLHVKGCEDVYASFDKYVEVELLRGPNRYYVDRHGLQEARKRVLFVDFPPVLQLQLKRFEYDAIKGTMVKINDRYEFPLQLDLDRANQKYLSPEADRSVRNLYSLHSVFVHAGGIHGGHYYIYLRPTLSGQWFKFDDEWVTKEVEERALEDQFGSMKKVECSNAYILVYVRESDKDKIMCNVDEKDLPKHLKIRSKNEQEEKKQKRKETAKPHQHTIVKVVHDKDLRQQIGKDMFLDLVDFDKVACFRIHNRMPFRILKEKVAKKYGIPVEKQRFWLWEYSPNRTCRPRRPLTPQEEKSNVGDLGKPSDKENVLNLFVDDTIPRNAEDILLFFKVYNPLNEELRYVGRKYVKRTTKTRKISSALNEMVGFVSGEAIDLYEEKEFDPIVTCIPINKELTFCASKLRDGDIIWCQKSCQAGNDNQCRYPDVPSFLHYVQNRQVVCFRSLEEPEKDKFELELSKYDKYDDVINKVARHLRLGDPSTITLTSHDCYSRKPELLPVKHMREVEVLSDMLDNYNETSSILTSDILYYKVLDIYLPEFERPKALVVYFRRASRDQVVACTIRLPKLSTVENVLDGVKTKVELSHPNAELRLLEVLHSRIFRILPLSLNIEDIDYILLAEEIPEEEKVLGPCDHLICVCNFKKTPTADPEVQYFGFPFLLVIHEGETLAEVKVRIQKKIRVLDEVSKIALFQSSLPEYLQDSDIVSNCFLKREIFDVWEQYIGLDHTNNTPAGKQDHLKSLKIYN